MLNNIIHQLKKQGQTKSKPIQQQEIIKKRAEMNKILKNQHI